MKNEDSGQSLLFLSVLALAVSGIYFVATFYPAFSPLTGYPTLQNATVSAEILRTTSIVVTGAISFGTGILYKNNSVQPIMLNSTGDCAARNTSFATNACVPRSATNPADNSTNKFTIENDGNINVTVVMDINSSISLLGLGLGGDFAFWLGQEEQSSATKPACVTTNGTGEGDSAPAGFFPNRTGYRHANQTGLTVNGIPVSIFSVPGTSNAGGSATIVACSKLQPDDLFDTINMTVYLNISTGAVVGAKNYRLNFTALDRFTTEG